MHYENEASHIRREVLARIARAAMAGDLGETIDLIPLQMRPKGAAAKRCCIYKDRAVIRYRCMAALGLGVEEETDERTDLSEFAARALARTEVVAPILTVLDAACSACVRAHYQVTDACRGCMARPCTLNCPKDAILLLEGQAKIDQGLCVNCGKCMKVCPYHAIIRVPIPCEEACPVGAIAKDESGKEQIDYGKCIFCGKCMSACPFGAVAEKSQVLDVLRAILAGRRVVAMIAPAVVGQFGGGLARIVAATKRLGFHDAIEVALGADKVAEDEAAEFRHRMAAGERMMTCSCCPAYTEAARKHISALAAFISKTPTPMHETAVLAKAKHPGAVAVFVGPCVAKRKEALDDPLVEYALTFEELAALFEAKGIDVASCEPAALDAEAHREGRGFPISGGVAGAIRALVCAAGESSDVPTSEVRPAYVNGLTRQSLKLLESYAKGPCPGNLLEVMACEGGCVAGPAVIATPVQAASKVEQIKKASATLGVARDGAGS